MLPQLTDLTDRTDKKISRIGAMSSWENEEAAIPGNRNPMHLGPQCPDSRHRPSGPFCPAIAKKR